MNDSVKNRNQNIVFRQWSGKSYAIFAALGKEVSIGHINADITDKSVLKSKNGLPNILTAETTFSKDEIDEEVENAILSEEQILSLLVTINSSDISSGRLPFYQNKNTLSDFAFSGLNVFVVLHLFAMRELVFAKKKIK